MSKPVGVPSKVIVHVGRKRTDGNYGSFDVSFGIEVDIPHDADVNDLMDQWDAFLTAKIAQSMNEKEGKIQPRREQPEQEFAQYQDAPSWTEQREPVVEGYEDSETETIPVEMLSVQFSQKDGSRFLKVKGGKWAKWGAACWPEVYNTIGIHISEMDGGDYPPSAFNLKPNLKAVVAMKDGKPQKVIGWA